MRLCNTIMEKAQMSSMLPDKADKVLEELVDRLRRVIRETDFQRKDRLCKEFDRLEMGRHSHADFRTMFEEKLMLMEQAGLSIVGNVDDLKRKHISKLPTDLRRAVLNQAWPLDGPDQLPRRPRT